MPIFLCLSKYDTTHLILCGLPASFTLQGGPLVLGKGGSKEGPLSPVVQVGIASFTSIYGCQNAEYPSVFTHVSKVVNWITTTVFHRTGEIVETTASTAPPTSGKSSKKTSKSGKDPKKFLRI